MGIFRPSKLEDLLQFVSHNCNPSTHIVVTDEDEQNYLYLVPIVTSQHRHYVVIDSWEPDKIREAVERLRKIGFKIVHGAFEIKQC